MLAGLHDNFSPLRIAAGQYTARPYAGHMTLSRATKQPLDIYKDPALGWGELVQGGIEIDEAPGFRAYMVV